MAEDSDGEGGGGVGGRRWRRLRRAGRRTPPRHFLETCVITCRGNLHDPHFPTQFKFILSQLRGLLCKGSGEWLRVNKVEPWNSVRVTFTIPAEAAERLRALAQGGDPALARLGILSVQLQADQVISVRIAPAGGRGEVEPQEVLLQVPPQQPQPAQPPPQPPQPVVVVGGQPPTQQQQVSFRSPNVVVGAAVAGEGVGGVAASSPQYKSPAPAQTPTPQSQPHQLFPFASMTHAATAIHSREQQQRYPTPPPYPIKSSTSATNSSSSSTSSTSSSSSCGNVSLTSPLLVNLLQTDGGGGCTAVPQQQAPPQPQTPTAPQLQPIVANVRLKQTTVEDSGGGSSAFVQVPSSRYPAPAQQVVRYAAPPQAPPPAYRAPLRPPQPTAVPRLPSGSAPPPPYPHHHLQQQQLINRSALPTIMVKEEKSPVTPGPTTTISISSVPPVTTNAAPGAPVVKDPSPSPPPPEFTSSGKQRQMLINPLTGVLEPMSSDSESEAETERTNEKANDDFGGFPSPPPPTTSLPPPLVSAPQPIPFNASAVSNCVISGGVLVDRTLFPDEDDNDSTGVMRRLEGGGDTRRCVPPPPPPQVNEKIKLRLKLEKNEPYKVDIVNSTIVRTGIAGVIGSADVEEPRVPPLHISLRGRNAAVVVASSSGGGGVAALRRDKKNRDGKNRIKLKKGDDDVIIIKKKNRPEEQSPVEAVSATPTPPPTTAAPTITGVMPCNLPARNYPTEAEVASILRSMPAGHKLIDAPLDDPEAAKLKKRDSKKKLYPRERGLLQAARLEEKQRTKKGNGAGIVAGSGAPPGTLLKSVVKSAAPKDVRIMAARLASTRTTATTTQPASRRELTPGTVPTESFQGSQVTLKTSSGINSDIVEGGTGPGSGYRPKVNCVFGGGSSGGNPIVVPDGKRFSSTTGVAAPPSPIVKKQEVVVARVEVKNGPVQETDVQLKQRLIEIREEESKKEGGAKPGGGGEPAANNQGEDSGIESMDALSEKSPNQTGESPTRKEDAKTTPPTVAAGQPRGEEGVEHKDADDEVIKDEPPTSPPDDPVPLRLTPALYTYSNPERSHHQRGGADEEGSPPPPPPSPPLPPPPSVAPPTTPDEDPHHHHHLRAKRRRKESNDQDATADQFDDTRQHGSTRSCRQLSNGSGGSGSNKSLLEQLLIEIPSENTAERRSSVARSTRSSHQLATSHASSRLCQRSPSESQRISPNSPVVILGGTKRTRKASESSTASHDDPSPASSSQQPRPNKRKCSENAAELIKACMGVEEQQQPQPSKREATSGSALHKTRKGGSTRGTPVPPDSTESSDEEDESTTPTSAAPPPDPTSRPPPSRTATADTLSSRLRTKDDDRRRGDASNASRSCVSVPGRRQVRQASSGVGAKSAAAGLANHTSATAAHHHNHLLTAAGSTANPASAAAAKLPDTSRRKTRSLAATGEDSKRRRSSRDGK